MLVKKIEVLFFWKKNESFSHVLTESIWLFYLKDFFLYSHYVDFTDDFFQYVLSKFNFRCTYKIVCKIMYISIDFYGIICYFFKLNLNGNGLSQKPLWYYSYTTKLSQRIPMSHYH